MKIKRYTVQKITCMISYTGFTVLWRCPVPMMATPSAPMAQRHPLLHAGKNLDARLDRVERIARFMSHALVSRAFARTLAEIDAYADSTEWLMECGIDRLDDLALPVAF